MQSAQSSIIYQELWALLARSRVKDGADFKNDILSISTRQA